MFQAFVIGFRVPLNDGSWPILDATGSDIRTTQAPIIRELPTTFGYFMGSLMTACPRGSWIGTASSCNYVDFVLGLKHFPASQSMYYVGGLQCLRVSKSQSRQVIDLGGAC